MRPQGPWTANAPSLLARGAQSQSALPGNSTVAPGQHRQPAEALTEWLQPVGRRRVHVRGRACHG